VKRFKSSGTLLPEERSRLFFDWSDHAYLVYALMMRR
jgi:hypothetical protein